MTARRRMSAKEALAQVFDPAGKTVVDVGCGDGALVRHFAALGAMAIGLEIDEAQLARARAKPAENVRYEVGRAEKLPFTDAFADAIIFLNSFHHVDPDGMTAALNEASRVLKRGGVLVVIEPIAKGDYFEAMRPLEDETEVRRLAYEALSRAPQTLNPVSEETYDTEVRFRDVEHFLQAIVAPDPERRKRLPEVEAELRLRFAKLAQPDADGYFFTTLLRRHVFTENSH